MSKKDRFKPEWVDDKEAISKMLDNASIPPEELATSPVYAETPDELETRIAKLESRLDWLYRWTLSDRNGHKYYSPAFTERAKDDRFPLPDYDAPGGPRKPHG